MADISISVRRGFALALCVMFLLLVVLAPTAKAVFTELVVGGVVASGAGAVIALGATVLLLTMTVSNLRDAANAAAEEAGTDTKTWLKSKIQEYAIDTGTTIQSVIQGLGFTKDGKITFSQALGSWAADVMNWLISNEEINPPVTPSYGSVITDVGEIYVLNSGSYLMGYMSNNPNNPMYINIVGNNVFSYCAINSLGFKQKLVFISDYPIEVTWSGFSIRSYDLNGVYYCQVGENGYVQYNTFFPLVNSTALPTAQQWEDWTGSYTGVEEGYNTGIWDDEEADEGYVLDPTGVLGLDDAGAIPDALDGSMVDINDYLDVLSDALAGDDPIALDLVGGEVLPLPGIDTATDIPVTVPDTAVDDAYPATGENTPDDVPYTGTGEYSLNLTNFFPFCIPFDIYRMLRLFDSQAEAPEITIPIVVDSLGISEEISIDLSVFDSVAQILRTVELIAFCVGLAFVTKKLIQGG